MKKCFILAALLFTGLFSSQAADIYYYQARFSEKIDSISLGLIDDEEFKDMVASLDSLQIGLEAETSITKKEPLLSEIKAVYAFIGEISPGPKSYGLDIDQKAKAIELLGLTEEEFPDSTSCLPITKIELWDDYDCYLVTNNSDSMMIKYKYNFLVERKYSSSTGFVDAGVSVKSSRSIYETFRTDGNIVFVQEQCLEQIGVVQYVAQDTVMPDYVAYAEPDYLSPQQKKELKEKMRDQLKKDKIKKKKKIVKEKKKKKKKILKAKKKKKKEIAKKRSLKKKEKKKAMKAKKKEKKEKKKEREKAKKAAKKK